MNMNKREALAYLMQNRATDQKCGTSTNGALWIARLADGAEIYIRPRKGLWSIASIDRAIAESTKPGPGGRMTP